MAVGATEFRSVLARVATAVAVVTVPGADGAAYGMTIGSLCSLSLTPPLVLYCLAHRAAAYRPLRAAERFCVSVLAAEQADAARRFATGGGTRRTEGLVPADGLPAVPDALAWLSCSRQRLVEAGDHTIVIGRVERAAGRAGLPLLYYDRGYHASSPMDALR